MRSIRDDKRAAKNERARRKFERAMKHLETTFFESLPEREW